MESQQILEFEGIMIALFVLLSILTLYNLWAFWLWLRRKRVKNEKSTTPNRLQKFESYTPGKL